MIIKYPTGLYASSLPHSPSDAGNVTFTISSTEPPRTSLLFPKLPPGVSGRRRTPKVIDVAQRRKDVNNLLFTINSVSRAVTATSIRQYEVGQLLNFGDVESLRALDPDTSGFSSEIRHDTGLLDYERLGFTPSQQQVVEAEADLAYRRLEVELSSNRQDNSDLQIQIGENKKLLTEAGKALDALSAMGSSDPIIVAMVANLMTKRQTLNAQLGTLINRANAASRAASATLAALRDMAQVVR